MAFRDGGLVCTDEVSSVVCGCFSAAGGGGGDDLLSIGGGSVIFLKGAEKIELRNSTISTTQIKHIHNNETVWGDILFCFCFTKHLNVTKRMSIFYFKNRLILLTCRNIYTKSREGD